MVRILKNHNNYNLIVIGGGFGMFAVKSENRVVENIESCRCASRTNMKRRVVAALSLEIVGYLAS